VTGTVHVGRARSPVRASAASGPRRDRGTTGAPWRLGSGRMSVRRAVAIALPPVLLAVAGWVIHRELAGVHVHDLQRAVGAVPRSAAALALAATALDYLLLTLYDVLALRHAGRALPYPRVALTSFVAYAFGNNVGLSLLSSSSVRLRLYSQWGLSGPEVAQVVAFTAAQLWAGLLPLVGAALLLGAPVPLPPAAARAVGVAALGLAAAYLVAAARVRRELGFRGLSVRLPSLPLAAGQVVVSALDWAVAALVLYLLLPRGAIGYPAFLGLFVAAQAVGLASQVPGGLGVFDSVVLATLSPAVPAPALVGSLVAFRAIYYLAPFVVAFALLVANELAVRRAWVGRVVQGAHASFAPIVPWAAAGASLVAGTVLLVSGATPAVGDRIHLLRRALPLPVLEASHLLGSVVGTALLLLGRSLARRLDGAWVVLVALLGAGAALSLVKGLDWEEALLLTALLAALLPFRREFYRRSSLLGERLGAGWTVAVAAILGASIWIGFFSYRHVDYSHDLWFRFAFHADAPRFLRASVAGVSLAVLVSVARLLRPAPHDPALPGEAELARARPVIDRAADSGAHLALVGDKPLLLSPSGSAFLMYGVEGRSWVAMGDPAGPEPEATELAWRFRELSDRHGGWTCFYQVGPRHLGRYLDLGLSLVKLGEEAIVPLGTFSLDGGERRALRQAYRRAERDGLAFRMAGAAEVPPLLPELRRVSDEWLAEKRSREKGFSLGFFDARYLCEGPVALVLSAGRIVAFANVWAGSCRAELSVDLMRHAAGAPRSAMDFLFVSLLAWGKAQGYEAFNLGMAPFSGLEDRALAPLWTKLGARLYRHGEYFYAFQGLRQYKEKFAPEWRPRYLATPGGLFLPVILTNVAALVSRGPKGAPPR
jgi:phosphatidylglycerol lysyltransferase